MLFTFFLVGVIVFISISTSHLTPIDLKEQLLVCPAIPRHRTDSNGPGIHMHTSTSVKKLKILKIQYLYSAISGSEISSLYFIKSNEHEVPILIAHIGALRL